MDFNRYPKSGKEISFDFKLFFVFHVSMMALWLIGRGLSFEAEAGLVCAILIVLAGLSIYHRVKSDWHWPGVRARGVFSATISLICSFVFLGSVSQIVSPFNPMFFPFFAAIGGIFLFAVLSALNIVFPSKSEFEKYCGEQRLTKPETKTPPNEPTWKKVARNVYALLSLSVWIVSAAFFWHWGKAQHRAAPDQIGEQSEQSAEHGENAKMTKEDASTLSTLMSIMIVGIPSVIALGLLLHLVLGVMIFPNMPTFNEIAKRYRE